MPSRAALIEFNVLPGATYRKRRRTLVAAAAQGAIIAASGWLPRSVAAAQPDSAAPLATEASPPWPTRPIRLIAVAPPGSSLDVLARVLAQHLHEALGQSVVVDNRPQAGGTAGTDAVAKAAADGTTLGLSFTGPLSLAPLLYTRLPYVPARDLAAVALLGTAPNVLAVPAALPVTDFNAFMAWVRARPGQLNYASVGNGSSSHLAMELLKQRAGLFIVHIPYNGAPPAAQATAAGDVQAIMSNPTALLPLIAAGRLRPLAVTSADRRPGMPQLPTVAECGFAGFESTAWNGIVAPAATPAPLIARLAALINAALRNPELIRRFEAAGWTPQPGTPQQFATLMAQETERYRAVVKRAHITLD